MLLNFLAPLLLLAAPLASAQIAMTGCSCDGYNIGITFENGTTQSNVRPSPSLLADKQDILKTRANNGVGWCIKDGALLPFWRNEILTALQTNTDTAFVNAPWAFAFYNRGTGGGQTNVMAIYNAIVSQITSIVMFNAPTCDNTYPTDPNWEPSGCDPSCQFKCIEGFTLCGDRSCIDPAKQSCVSDTPVDLLRRRRLTCRPGFESCPVPQGRGAECIDTSSNLEACGGCPGTRLSQDCSSIPGVADVACVKGECQVARCLSSYTLRDGVCVPRLPRSL